MQMPTVADAKNNNQTKAECQMTKEMTYKKKPKAKIQKIKIKKMKTKIQMTKSTQCLPPDFSISFRYFQFMTTDGNFCNF